MSRAGRPRGGFFRGSRFSGKGPIARAIAHAMFAAAEMLWRRKEEEHEECS
jgi:hypothetical protein